ncbi:uncharacterized protein [Nicotiana sylvestris]|uniref:uncharacterized protein n=1 Tax=Nicotiana sylvestris TaxID=4096 RepID=UPI00388CA764
MDLASLVTTKQKLLFIQEVIETEVIQALKDLPADKAPDIDGFPTEFFKKYWHLIGEKVTKATMQFFQIGKMLKEGYTQKRVSPRCLVKVDIRKAYDIVEWGFLRMVLLEFGIPEKFIPQAAETQSRFQLSPKMQQLEIVYICFVDDLIICYRADPIFVKLMLLQFHHFSTISGLKENLEKVHCSHESSRKALVVWETLCKPHSAGGLNFIEFYTWNRASISKLLWVVATKKDAL